MSINFIKLKKFTNSKNAIIADKINNCYDNCFNQTIKK